MCSYQKGMLVGLVMPTEQERSRCELVSPLACREADRVVHTTPPPQGHLRHNWVTAWAKAMERELLGQ